MSSAATGRPLIACDLDRTLIYSAAALGLSGPDAAAPRLVVAEVYDGAPLSYLTRRADALLRELAAATTFVPTTTRTVAQYERVRLFEAPPRYAVTTNGARILIDGVPDPEWSVAVAARLADSAPVPQIDAYLAKVADPRWTRSRRIAEDAFCYLVVNRAELPASFVADLTGWCEPQGWTVSLQGRKIYAVPQGLVKAAAVTEIARRVDAPQVLAAGDSLLDADLLESASLGFRPAHGELHDAGWTRPHVTVTETAGVLAGEEILDRLWAACC